MGTEAKTLLVIYKEEDEVALHQLKKLVEQKGDKAKPEIGSEDETVNIVAWNEELYLENKDSRNIECISDKILFIGDIEGTEMSTLAMDVRCNEFGVSYGFCGKQAFLLVDPESVRKKADYDAFAQELKDISNSKVVSETPKHSLKNKKTWIKLGTCFLPPFGGLNYMFWLNSLQKDFFGDKKLVRTQQLVYGITRLYLKDLEQFMNE